MAPLLQVNDLRTSFFTSDGEVRAVDGVTFDIDDGRTVGLVGESGCGKSVTALSIIQLLPRAPGRIVGGERPVSRHGSRAPPRRGDAPHPRQRDLDDLPGADDLAQSGHDGRRPDRRNRAAASRREPQRGARPRHRDAEPGQDRRAAQSGSGIFRTSSPAASASAS